MKIFEYLMRKRLFGEGLNAMEEQVLVNLINSDPKVKAKAAHWWQQWIEVQTIGGTMADVFPEEKIGVKESPSKTFPHSNDFLTGGSYRR